jgi:hypothetical protein
LEKYCEDLIKIPFAQKIYIRLNWRDIQKRPGRLDFPEGWKITFDLAKRYNKRVGFRIMLENPDFPEPGMPEFLMEKVPYVKLQGEWKGNPANPRYQKDHRMPRYDHPEYQAAFRELNAMLAAELNGNPLVEYMDTMMYGFWGEGTHLAIYRPSVPGQRHRRTDLDEDAGYAIGVLDQDAAGHQHSAGLEPRGQFGDVGSIHPYAQLDSHRHHLY